MAPASSRPAVCQEVPLPEIAGHRILRVLNHSDSALGWGPLTHVSPIVGFEDSDHQFWFGASQGGLRVVRYEEVNGRWTRYSDHALRSSGGVNFSSDALLPIGLSAIAQTGDRRLWFSGKYAGLPQAVAGGRVPPPEFTYFDGARWRIGAPKLTNYAGTVNTGIFSGREGRVWFWKKSELVSYDGYRWSDPIKLDQVLPNVADPFYITAGVEGHDGRVWLQTHQGVVSSDMSRRKWSWRPEIPAAAGETVYQDHWGRLWFIAFRSIVTFDPESNRLLPVLGPGREPLTGSSRTLTRYARTTRVGCFSDSALDPAWLCTTSSAVNGGGSTLSRWACQTTSQPYSRTTLGESGSQRGLGLWSWNPDKRRCGLPWDGQGDRNGRSNNQLLGHTSATHFNDFGGSG